MREAEIMVDFMGQSTKDRIIELGAHIMHLKGFNHTGIQEILDAAGVPKGSFYNYFRSKEDFGLQVIDYFVGYFNQFTKGITSDLSLSPLEKIRRILEQFTAFFESKDYAYGCPVGNLSQEMGDLSPAFREKLKEALDNMAGIYAQLLKEAQERGELSISIDPTEAAYFIVSSWHGALIRMKVEKSSEPLKSHLKFIFDYILEHQ
ncbi:MAG: TetR family transcriptional regulator C-terminal domain-containing protein [Desulfobacteraceae bacterium]|jgi:TetR/AcrR family transcriptional repressor of nem operon